MSTNNIEKGSQWQSGLALELENARVGVICLTPENLKSTWLHFEAGALAKKQQQQGTRVCTFLYGEPIELREPLSYFQATRAEKEDIRKLIHTINRTMGEASILDKEKVDLSFDTWWPRLEARLKNIADSKYEPQRPSSEILALSPDSSGPTMAYVSNIIGGPRIVLGRDLTDKDVELLANHFRITLAQVRLMNFVEDLLISLRG